MKLRQRYPQKEHTLDDLRPHFDEFQALKPDVFADFRKSMGLSPFYN